MNSIPCELLIRREEAVVRRMCSALPHRTLTRMPRGIPNVKRDETGLRYTSFNVPLVLVSPICPFVHPLLTTRS